MYSSSHEAIKASDSTTKTVSGCRFAAHVGYASRSSFLWSEEAGEAQAKALVSGPSAPMAHASVISEAEARRIIAMPKFLAVDIQYVQSPTNSAFKQFDANLVDELGATIPGLSVVVAFRRGTIAPNDCKFHFTVLAFAPPHGRLRAYQLEIVPEDKKSSIHAGAPIYGPHEHIGDHVEEVRVEALGCMDHEAWFREFCRRANIQFGMKYFGPSSGELFP